MPQINYNSDKQILLFGMFFEFLFIGIVGMVWNWRRRDFIELFVILPVQRNEGQSKVGVSDHVLKGKLLNLCTYTGFNQ